MVRVVGVAGADGRGGSEGGSEGGGGSPAFVGNAEKAPRQARPQAQREGAPLHRRCEAGRAAVARVDPREATLAGHQLRDPVAKVAALLGEAGRLGRRGRHEERAAREQRRLRCVGLQAGCMGWQPPARRAAAPRHAGLQPPARGVAASSTRGVAASSPRGCSLQHAGLQRLRRASTLAAIATWPRAPGCLPSPCTEAFGRGTASSSRGNATTALR